MIQNQVPFTQESWIELSASALKQNILEFKKITSPSSQIGVVLKGNAYGHGLKEILSLVHGQVDCIYLIAARDAFWIRKFEKENQLPLHRILVIGVTSESEILECARLGIEITLGVTDWRRFVPQMRANQSRVQAHLHLDTGLSREGIREVDLEKEIQDLKKYTDWIKLIGVMSHFSNTEDVTEQEYAHAQLEAFERMSSQVQKIFGESSPLEKHFAASAATLVLPQSRYDRVRVGISLYGMWPSTEARISSKLVLKEVPELKPVLSWRCQSQIIKAIPQGTYVGYGCTYRCEHDSVIAVFPVGYFDGYPRLASGKAHVLVHGRRCPVIGRVMMNHLIVDVTSVIRPGESEVLATLIGVDGEEKITPELLASWAQTIPYEIVTRLGAHLQRVVRNSI